MGSDQINGVEWIPNMSAVFEKISSLGCSYDSEVRMTCDGRINLKITLYISHLVTLSATKQPSQCQICPIFND